MGEVAKKKSATWRADAGSQKKKRKKRRRTKMKQHEKKRNEKGDAGLFAVDGLLKHGTRFLLLLLLLFFHVVAAREELSLEGRGPLSWASLGSFVIFVLSVTGFRVMLRGCLWLSFFFFFFCFFLVCRLCVCLFPFDGRFFGWASDFRRLMFSSW